jgi:hypothetical protein
MSAERQRREEEIFHAALDIVDPAQRDAYVREACGADLELRRDVEELLQAHERTGLEPLTEPGDEAGWAEDTLVGEKPGDQTPLHDAARSGQGDAARLLVEFDADRNTRNRDGLIPAEEARNAGHHELADWLLNPTSSANG